MDFLSYRFLLMLYLVSIACCSHAIIPLLAESLPSSQPSHLCHDHERSALHQFKQSFIINCAASASSSAYPKVRSWAHNEGNCCSWDGITCDKDTGHVIALDLGNSCLYGSFPSNTTLISLTNLQELSLNDNHFNYSPIPSELGRFTKLKILNLGRSVFSGRIPFEISNLSQLFFLDLSEDDFSLLTLEDPGLEKLVGNMTFLNTLILDGVQISSPVPIMFSNLTSLRAVTLGGCNLHGHFPPSIFHLPNLEILDLSNNVNLGGCLPQFQQNSPIKDLSIFYTAFSGNIPPSIGNLVHLEKLRLHAGHFSGPIPSSLGNCTKLTILDLFHSDFSGKLPSSLTNLTLLRVLALSHLTVAPEMLNPWLRKLNNLAELGLSNINFASGIPVSIANITNLQVLDLTGDQIPGQVPNWLMNLTRLQKLSLKDNQLKGPIPSQGILQLVNLEALSFGGNNNLSCNFDELLKLKYLDDLDLSGVKLTFLGRSMANNSVSKLVLLNLDSCNLTEFPLSLHSQDAVQELTLSNNNIHGAIPEWFVNITRDSLRILDLSHNFLTGFEQPIGVLPRSKLKKLNVQGNQLQGLLPIPTRSTIIYQVSDNQFAGIISHEFCNNGNSIKYFDASNNNLRGQIPECISRMGGSLFVLNLKGNNFQGSIPRAYPKSCALEVINFSSNQLHGNIPRSLVNCINLQVLDIGQNHVNDTFPAWLGSLPQLHILILRRNNFHGKIGRPKAGHHFKSLRIIDLSDNSHTGQLPFQHFRNLDAMKATSVGSSITSGTIVQLEIIMPNEAMSYSIEYDCSITITIKGNEMLYEKVLTVFRVIDLSSNSFTGTIPYFVGELRGIQALNLSNNNLSGSIPSSLVNMTDLESLDLSNNMLSGEIPSELTKSTFLEVFNVSHNHLTGVIPQGNQFGTFDNSSFVGNFGLCGPPLSKKCTNANGPPSRPEAVQSDDKEEGDSKLIDWIVRSSGYVAGFAVSCALWKYITDRNHQWFVETFGRRRRKPTVRQRS